MNGGMNEWMNGWMNEGLTAEMLPHSADLQRYDDRRCD